MGGLYEKSTSCQLFFPKYFEVDPDAENHDLDTRNHGGMLPYQEARFVPYEFVPVFCKNSIQMRPTITREISP